MDEEYNKKYENFIKKLNENSIRILCSDWKEDKIDLYEKVQNEEKDKKLNKILKQKLENKKVPYLIYNYNYESEKLLPEKLNKLKAKEKEPSLKFRASRLLRKPYEIVENINKSMKDINNRKLILLFLTSFLICKYLSSIKLLLIK